MSVALENIVVGFTCPECEREETAGLDSLVVVGAPMCSECGTEMDADTTADVLTDEDAAEYTFDQMEVGFNGANDDPWIDLTFHDDTRSEDMPTIVAHVAMRPSEAMRLRDKLYSRIRNLT